MTTYSWKSGSSGVWSTATLWTPAGPPNAATSDAVIGVAGTYAVTQVASTTDTLDSLVLSDANATLFVAGTLDFNGANQLAVKAGTLVLTGLIQNATVTNPGGVIDYGTIANTGGTLNQVTYYGGTLSAVTYQGEVDLSPAYSQLTIENGFHLNGASGSGAGSINLTGQFSSLTAATSLALNNATISIGNDAYLELDVSLGTLTLGANLTLQQVGGAVAYLFDEIGNGTIVNLGTIDAEVAGDVLYVDAGVFTNQGLITVANGGGFVDLATSFSNTGSIAVGAGSTLTLEGNWTNTGNITATDASVDLYGSFSTAQLQTLTLSDDQVVLDGTLVNTGATLAVGPAVSLTNLGLASSGDIVGGTIADSGSGLVFGDGTLDGVTYQGTMDLSPAASYAFIADGITLQGAGGSGTGAINLTGFGSNLFLTTSATLDHATISIGNDSALNLYLDSGTLTLGPHLTLQLAGTGEADIDDVYGDGFLINFGTIEATVSGEALQVDGNSFVNDGLVNVAGGGVFIDNVTTWQNAGTVTVTGGGTLSLAAGWLNSGVLSVTAGGVLALGGAGSGPINVTQATVDLLGTFTTAQVLALTLSGATVILDGTLVNTGATLAVGPGSHIATFQLAADGEIVGGVIADAGGGVAFGGGTLDGVTYQGTMNLSPAGSAVVIAGGITLQGVAGIGAGAINLTGQGNNVTVATSTTLNNATIQIGAGASLDLTASGGTLTLGANLLVLGAGGAGTLSDGGTVGSQLVNLGTIDFALAGASGTIAGSSFTNTGLLETAKNDPVAIQSAVWTNLSGGTLTGGTYAVAPATTLQLPQNVTLSTLDAVVTLTGAGSRIASYNTATSTQIMLESMLSVIGATGVLRLLSGSGNSRGFGSLTTLTDNGQIVLTGGTFTDTGTLTIGATGTLFGNGLMQSPIANNGLIEANGATLTLAGIVTGSGTIVIDSGSRLRLSKNLAATSIIDNGTMAFGYATYAAAVSVSASGDLVGLGTITHSIANAGILEASGGLLLVAGSVTGSGTILIDAYSKLQLQGSTSAGTITDRGTLALGYGQYTVTTLTVMAGGDLAGLGTIIHGIANAGTLEASGGLLVVDGAVTGSGTIQADAASKLQLRGGAAAGAIVDRGTLELVGNATAGTLTDTGILQLDGVTVTVTAASVASNGTIVGSGVFLGPIADSGVITANGGLLALGAVTGGGALQIGIHATLELTGASSASAAFSANGAASLLLDAQSSFSGTIQGLILGDSLVFKNELLNSAAITGTTLAVVGSAGTFDVQVAGALTGHHFAVQTDQHTLILTAGAQT